MKRVLITGITGYIGSHLARRLLSNCEVYGLIREPLNLEYIEELQRDIHFVCYDGSYESMAAAIQTSRPDLVYHLAAYYTGSHSPEHFQKLLDSNIILSAHLLEAMTQQKIKGLVYASTIMTYYHRNAYCPLNLYAATKQACSDLLAYYTDVGLLRAVTLVLSDTYGPGDHRPKILNLVKHAAQSGERLELSDGQQDYDVVYIDDVVSAFRQAGELLLKNPEWKNETFQVCSPAPLSLHETVERMLAVNHLTLNAAWGKRPNAEREIRKAVRLYPTVPGWTAQVSLDEGLKRFQKNTE